MVATKETDDRLRREYRLRGANDRDDGIGRDCCPYDGLIAQWWYEGWDGIRPEIPTAQ